MKIKRFDANERMCDMAAVGALVFVSGQVPDTLDASIEQQCREVFRKIDTMLDRAGTNKSHLLTTTIYLSDFRHYAGLNSAWDQWVDKDNPPARDCFKLELANPGWKVEIVVTAAQPECGST